VIINLSKLIGKNDRLTIRMAFVILI